MNAEATNDPGHNEYLAAAAGMRETYGWRDTSNTPKTPTYAIGDFVSGVSAGKRWQGRIWEIEGDRLSIEIDGGWLAVSAKDVTH